MTNLNWYDRLDVHINISRRDLLETAMALRASNHKIAVTLENAALVDTKSVYCHIETERNKDS